MATVFILLCGVLGFLAGVTVYFVFGVSLLTATAIWFGAGPVAILVVMARACVRPPGSGEDPVLAETA